ncbi:MAG: class I SAM-dependent methyltransferase [Azoarcus sp.]|jgi:SAM-dependent methyltransferase|nr:class I SAM-dependent methyltransferase [Azoarcus sp.]
MRLSSAPPALKALFAQLCGWGAVWLLGQLLPDGVWMLAFSQAVAATLAAMALRSTRWWLAIHFVFTPLAFAAHALEIPPAAWLAAFVVFALIFWSSYRTQVPLFLSNRQTACAVAGLLPPGPIEVLDIGCGIGSFLAAFAQQRRDARLTGIESAPVPFALSRIRKHPAITVIRGDFFAHSWAGYDLVYAFLSPVPMADVWEKARREMKPGSLLVSNSFGIPGIEPDRVIEVADRRQTRLLVFAIPATQS